MVENKKEDNDWFKKYELNDDQLEKLIENKFIRASEYRKLYQVREQPAEELE